MVSANFPFYLKICRKIEKKTCIKFKNEKNNGPNPRRKYWGGGKKFFLKPCPPQGKSEIAPLARRARKGD